MLWTASHLVIGLIGAVLLYVALFLRETEEGEMQNRLEKLWVEIDDLSKAALSKQTAFLQQISAMANSGLNRLFGVRLFSAEAVSASLCFSVGSVLLFRAYWQLVSIPAPHSHISVISVPYPPKAYVNIAVAYLIVGILSFVIGLLPIPFKYIGLLWIPGSISFLLYADRHMQWDWTFWIDELVPPLIILGGGFVSDVFFIALSRWCLRTGSKLQDGWRIVTLLTFNGCLGLALVLPMLWGIEMLSESGGYLEHTNVVVMYFGVSNVVDGSISLIFVLLSLVALLHLALWPILERPIYSLQRFGVARNPKLLATASVTCLVFAWPHSPIIQWITKLVHG